MFSSGSRGNSCFLEALKKVHWPAVFSLGMSEGDNLLDSHYTLGGLTCLKKEGWEGRLIMTSLMSNKLECCMARSVLLYVEISFLKGCLSLFRFFVCLGFFWLVGCFVLLEARLVWFVVWWFVVFCGLVFLVVFFFFNENVNLLGSMLGG